MKTPAHPRRNWYEETPRSNSIPSTGDAPRRRKDLTKITEIRMHEFESASRGHAQLKIAGPVASGNVGIQSDQPVDWRLMLQDPPGMPASAESGIDVGSARDQGESIDCLRKEDRHVASGGSTSR
jgi:hypothetical protein